MFYDHGSSVTLFEIKKNINCVTMYNLSFKKNYRPMFTSVMAILSDTGLYL